MMSLDGVADDTAAAVRDIVGAYDGRDLATSPGARYATDIDVPGALRSFPHPALVLKGTHETATRRAHARFVHETIPDARLLAFANSGHLCNLSEPDSYNRAVLDFIGTVEAER